MCSGAPVSMTSWVLVHVHLLNVNPIVTSQAQQSLMLLLLLLPLLCRYFNLSANSLEGPLPILRLHCQ
jgi:hypothetical protein